MIEHLSPKLLQRSLEAKGYAFFESEEGGNVNIIGIRSEDKTPNVFNDFIVCLWKFHGNWNLNVFSCTTDPGLYWLNNPINSLGTAILVPGQYRSAFKIGKHKGKYEALVQAKPVKVYRDNDRDSEFDMDESKIDEGIFGINIHHASYNNTSVQVDKWSAGCQVLNDIDQFNIFMQICRYGAKHFGPYFTYTLLEEADLLYN